MGASETGTERGRAGRSATVVAAVVPAALVVAAVLWLLVVGDGGVRPSADDTQTVPVWHRWLPPLAGIAALLLAPVVPASRRRRPGPEPVTRSTVLQTGALVLLAVLFAVALTVTGPAEPAFTGFKLLLLVAVPVLVLRRPRSESQVPPAQVQQVGPWPLVPILCWALVAYGTPLAPPRTSVWEDHDLMFLLTAIVVVFLVNAVIEEVFYRRWLQSRLEAVLGRAGGILWATVLWSVWHIAIQPLGRLDLDIAAALASHAVMGIFLGMLWSRYRRMWPLLVVHGGLNALPLLLVW